MQVKKLIVGQLKTNCYIVFDELSLEATIIDPGDDADFIIREVTSFRLKPLCILATHTHFDHVLGVLELQLAFNTPFIASKKDEFLLLRMQSSARQFLGVNVDRPPKINQYLKSGQKFTLGKSAFVVMETPGHTPGSCSFYFKKDNVIFSGDLIFEMGGIGRSDFKYSDSQALRDSVEKLLRLPEKTIVYSGHGNFFSLQEFKKYWYNQSS